MRDDNFRPTLHPLPRSPLLDVKDQPARGTTNIEVVHGIGSHAWEFGAAERSRSGALRRGHDLTNGRRRQSAGARRERLVTAIIRSLPLGALAKLAYQASC